MTAHPTSEILPTNSARQYLDGAMPQNVTDNDDDQLSHAAFLNAYLRPHGAGPVNLDAFRHLMGQYRGRADKNKISKWFTNFLNLNVDLSWYTRYRSEETDTGAILAIPSHAERLHKVSRLTFFSSFCIIEKYAPVLGNKAWGPTSLE
jgi:hypothetical protein